MTSSVAPARAAVTAVRANVTLEPFPMDGSVRTLGWGVIAWCEAYLLQPDGVNAGEPFTFTPEQLNFILWFYAVDAAGTFRYRRAVLRRAKGWGKSPFVAAICLAELCGPVVFNGWGEDGEPVGVPHPSPWINIAGVSERQVANTFDSLLAMARDSLLVDDYGLDVGMTRVLLPGNGGKIEPITASAASAEGARTTFAVMDEPHWWFDSNGGAKLAATIRRNLAKVRGRSIETTNAHMPGQDSVAERSFLAWRDIVEGKSRARGVLYDSREPEGVDLANEAELREGLRIAYGDATWADLDRLVAEIYDSDMSPEEARRFYLNQIVAAADGWTSPTEWDANYRPDLAPLKFGEPGKWEDGDTVTLGFDGGLTDDASALVAVRVSDGAPFLLGVWEKPEGPAGDGWAVPKPEVRDLIDYAFSTLDVVGFFMDVAYWETDVDRVLELYSERLLVKATPRHAVAWDMRGHKRDTVMGTEKLARAITDGEVPWTAHELIAGPARGARADEVLRRHVLNARRRPNRFGVAFGKESRESVKKVDALAALLLASIARARLLGEGTFRARRRKNTPGRLYGF